GFLPRDGTLSPPSIPWAIRSITSLSSVARARKNDGLPACVGRKPVSSKGCSACHASRRQARAPDALVVVFVFSFELEHVKQVADGRRIYRSVSILAVRLYRVRHVVAAAAADRRQVPVPFDELQNRNMVCIAVRNAALLRVGRNHQQRNAR